MSRRRSSGGKKRSPDSGEGSAHRKPFRGGKGGKPSRFRSDGRSGPGGAPRATARASEPAEDILPAKQQTEKLIHTWLREGEQAKRKMQLEAPAPSAKPSLDPWQQEAYDALVEGANVIVDAPTTAGKTRVVEAFFNDNIHRPQFRAAYTTPVKSLSNDKLREFRDMYGAENVGIATGDIKENLRAPIVVCTLETYRNSLLGVEPDLGRSLVIFDEYHFMQDVSRGSAWEEAIVLTPPNTQLLMLSASVANPDQVTAWVEKINPRPCRLIRTDKRPVPLKDLIYHRGAWLAQDVMDFPQNSRPQGDLARRPLGHEELCHRLKGLIPLGLTPAIIYAGRRFACESLATTLCRTLDPLPEDQSRLVKDFLEKENEKSQCLTFMKPNMRKMLIMYGVGYHHSGIAPAARHVMEIMVKEGLLRFCVATMGLSIGINFSVRATVISDYDRPGEQGFTQYSKSEVLQMLGRAGRRGRDAVGFSIWPSLTAFQKLGGAHREKLESRLRNDPTTFLGLVGRGFNLRDIENFYEKSFMRFGDRSVDLRLIRPDHIQTALSVPSLPCSSPAFEFSAYLHEESESICHNCPLRKGCHRQIENRMKGTLSYLHIHLHMIGCLDREEKLTPYGEVAKYFPQAGGLVLAKMIAFQEITSENLLAAVELMASFCLSRFKEPQVPQRYKFPFDAKGIESELENYYPFELFEEMYDPPFGRRDYPVIREYNPAAGYIVRQWLTGGDWKALSREITDERFGEGDLMALCFRVGTYLQSMSQAGLGSLGSAALAMRRELLREPLMPKIEQAKDIDETFDESSSVMPESF